MDLRAPVRREPAWSALRGAGRPRLTPETTCPCDADRAQVIMLETFRRLASPSVSRPWRTTDRSRGHAFGPRHVRAPRPGPKSRTQRLGAMRRVRGAARLQGFAPLERFVATRWRFRPPGARCSPGFSTSPGSSPSLPWAGASTGPPLTGLARARGSRRSYVPSAGPPKRSCWLPHRVSMSNEAGRSLARPASPREVRCLVVQPSTAELGRPWLMVSPQAPGYVAVP
jgi:hypothetical protein